MTSVSKLIEAKPPDIWFVRPDSSVFEAIKLMAEKGIGAVLVMESDKVVGIMSERDYARKVILQGKSSKDTPVRDIMTDKVFYVSPNQSIEECMGLMTDKHIRHLPVMSGDKVEGILSIGDLVKSIISEKEVLIEHLENYITGRA